MDRAIVYDSELPQTTDFLNSNKFGMLGLAYLSQAVLGGNVEVAGLICAPTVPASLQVTVGPGSIYAADETDANSYSDLGIDPINVIKQGVLRSPVTLTISPPATSGYSQIYLVQAILQDQDSGAVVLPYYNASNPSQPFSGPGNDAQPQYTIRSCLCTIALKAGTPALTGTQAIPMPDAGYVGLYAVTVVNGQATITSVNINLLVTAPFFPTLPSVPGAVQNETWVGFTDSSSTANTVTITPYPPVSSLQIYQRFTVKIARSNNAASVLQVQTPTATLSGPIQLPSGSPLVGGEMLAGSIAEFVFDGNAWELVSAAANAGSGGGGGGGGTAGPTYITGIFRNLVGSATGGTKTASWTIEQILAAVSLGSTTVYQGINLSLTFNGAGTGAGGMDVGSMPTSADLSIYAIYNPVSGIWNTLGVAGTTSNSTVYSSTHMPAGYTASQLIWAGKANASSNVIQFYQQDRRIHNGFLTVGNNLSSQAYMPFASITLASLIPIIAKTIELHVETANGNTGIVIVSSQNSYLGYCQNGSDANPSGLPCDSFPDLPLITPQTIYYQITTGGGYINLQMSSYTF